MNKGYKKLVSVQPAPHGGVIFHLPFCTLSRNIIIIKHCPCNVRNCRILPNICCNNAAVILKCPTGDTRVWGVMLLTQGAREGGVEAHGLLRFASLFTQYAYLIRIYAYLCAFYSVRQIHKIRIKYADDTHRHVSPRNTHADQIQHKYTP